MKAVDCAVAHRAYSVCVHVGAVVIKAVVPSKDLANDTSSLAPFALAMSSKLTAAVEDGDFVYA